MKKTLILLLITFTGFAGVQAQDAKPLTKKEAKKIANTVNTSLQDMAKSIEKMDWKSLEDLIQNTATILEKHTDAIVKIASSIDTKQIEKNAAQIAQQIERHVDVEKLEKDMEKIAVKIQEAAESEVKEKK